MTGAHNEIGRAFSEHRSQSERRGCLRAKLRRISCEIEKVQTAYDHPEATVHAAASAVQSIGESDGDVVAILNELADASRHVQGLSDDLQRHGMGSYIKD